MPFMREELQKYFYALTSVARALRSIGVDFELIGSMVLPVGYGMYWDVHDVDLFVIGESPFMNPDKFEELAGRNDWDVGTSAFGNMYMEVLAGDSMIRVDLMENALDVYIPSKLLEDSLAAAVGEDKIKVMRVEGLIVLKAREATDEAEEFLEELNERLGDSSIRLDKKKILSFINEYPSDERKSLRHRIEMAGIYLD
ncbi:nucleotidyltransferase [Thermocladium modestius]|uniref:Nucleotidyltransferase n=2 Tax=Thermocladium modestius TaxID=62609 RepID=A0A830GRW8_9CREN|nr:nucleotidyltransferase [Thermocladium modestius]